MQERTNILIQKMTKDGIDVFVVTKETDIRYLSGFTGEEGTTILVVSENKNYLVTDGRYLNQAKQETSGFEVIIYRKEDGLLGCTYKLILDLQLKHAAVDMSKISHLDYMKLTGHGKLNVEDVKPYLAEMRSVKESQEIESIRKACKITDAAFQSVIKMIKPGMTEIEIASELEYQFFKNGGDGIAFKTIIASGCVNGANCHATPSRRKIHQGDMITMDFGSTYEGYCSDVTRTVAVGTPDARLIEIYHIVKQAKADAQAVLKKGVTLKEIDTACKRIVTEGGYTIPHGIGHSFGYDIHEMPFISPKSDYALEENVVHTLEPGIYIPGIGGVRIEDDYLITKEGAEKLTHCQDELIIL